MDRDLKFINKYSRGRYRNFSKGSQDRSFNKKSIFIDQVLVYVVKNKKALDSENFKSAGDLQQMKKMVKEGTLKFPFAYFVFISKQQNVYAIWYNEIDKHYILNNRLDKDFSIINKAYNLNISKKEIPKDLSTSISLIIFAYMKVLIDPMLNPDGTIQKASDLYIDDKKTSIFLPFISA